MDELWVGLLPMVLAAVLLCLAVGGILLLSVDVLHRVGRRHPTRRRVPLWLSVLAVVALGMGALFGLDGWRHLADTDWGPERSIAGGVLMIGALVLQVGCVNLYVEAAPDAFIRRG